MSFFITKNILNINYILIQIKDLQKYYALLIHKFLPYQNITHTNYVLCDHHYITPLS